MLVLCCTSCTNASDRAYARALARVGTLRLINYYPADAPWARMWTHYDHRRTATDFAAIHTLGANAVRIIIDPYAVGWPQTTAAGNSAISDVLDTAEHYGLGVQLTLFDWWGQYDAIGASKTWLHSLTKDLAARPVVRLIEIQNEIDPRSAVAMNWARVMLSYAKGLFPTVPLTLSVKSATDGRLLTRLVDQIPHDLLQVISVHLYGALSNSGRVLETAQRLAHGRPIVVGESGYPTPANSPNGYRQQANYYLRMWNLCNQYKLLSFAPWTYSDFDETVVRRPEPNAYYGLRQVNGTWKLASRIVREMFAASARARTR